MADVQIFSLQSKGQGYETWLTHRYFHYSPKAKVMKHGWRRDILITVQRPRLWNMADVQIFSLQSKGQGYETWLTYRYSHYSPKAKVMKHGWRTDILITVQRPRLWNMADVQIFSLQSKSKGYETWLTYRYSHYSPKAKFMKHGWRTDILITVQRPSLWNMADIQIFSLQSKGQGYESWLAYRYSYYSPKAKVMKHACRTDILITVQRPRLWNMANVQIFSLQSKGQGYESWLTYRYSYYSPKGKVMKHGWRTDILITVQRPRLWNMANAQIFSLQSKGQTYETWLTYRYSYYCPKGKVMKHGWRTDILITVQRPRLWNIADVQIFPLQSKGQGYESWLTYTYSHYSPKAKVMKHGWRTDILITVQRPRLWNMADGQIFLLQSKD